MELTKNIIIFPCGEVASQIISILNNIYSIQPAYLIDNQKYKYSDNINEVSFLERIDTNEYVLLLASTNKDVYSELKLQALKYFSNERLVELECMKKIAKYDNYFQWTTKIGKYSYGPICRNHPFIKEIGSFCSFATGVEYVTNHEFRYITTHPMIFEGKNVDGYEWPFDVWEGEVFHFSGVDPRADKIKKQKRAIIGNDVWLGRNVIITNSSNIGNGVIAAAGAVVTKDIPDYAIVAGVPARIIKYRYTSEQINALNDIAWWDWPDDIIKERYDDFYISIEEFIKKYGK